MRAALIVLSLGAAALVAFFFGMSLAPAPATLADSLTEPGPESQSSRPVLVELFTSQGCSSCPPADALLEILAEDPHRDIIPLSFHVDYWNRLGWRDPFSSAEWSERQRLYNEAMRTGRVYTPQLVIDGRSHCVGSDVKTVYRQIDEALERSVGVDIELSVRPMSGRLEVTYKAGVRADGTSVESLADLDLMLALAETGLETSVKSGENARRTLHNEFVVRRLDRLGELNRKKTSLQGSFDLPVDGTLDLDRWRVVAFAQEPVGRQIRGSAVWAHLP